MDGVVFTTIDSAYIGWCGGDISKVSSKQFFEKDIFELLDGTNKTLFFKDLRVFGKAIVNTLKKNGYTDTTNEAVKSGYCKKVQEKCFTYIIGAGTNTWFNITISNNGGSLKILPFENFVSVKEDIIRKDFCDDDAEEGFVKGMVKAVSMMREIGCTRDTISSSATSLWKSGHNRYDFNKAFPEPTNEMYNFIKKGHHGGLCYVNRKGKAGNGIVLDVNSLYPYVMREKYLPSGKGEWFDGKPDDMWNVRSTATYFVRFKCRFNIKDGKIPFVRVRGDEKYNHNKILSTSDIYDRFTKKWYKYMVNDNGEKELIRADMVMYKDEFLLFLEHYDVEELEFIGGYKFTGWRGGFMKYVNQFSQMKENAKDKAERRIAKMMMNSLSGNLSKKRDRKSTVLEEGGTKFVDSTSRSRSYIYVGAAITSVAMCLIVRAAQANYKHFLYTDTDSLHLDCDIQDVVGVNIDDKMLGAFKIEHRFSSAYYIRQKVYYIDDIDEGMSVKWSGMRDASRKVLEGVLREVVDGKREAGVVEIPFEVDTLEDFENYRKIKAVGVHSIDIKELMC